MNPHPRAAAAAEKQIPISFNGNTATHQGESFHHGLDLTSGGNVAKQVDILVTATLPDGGDNNTPRVADAEKSAYLPPHPETFLHDADGNLTQDGKWSYDWDAENRLIAMETLPAAVAAGADPIKLEFGYDSQGRRFSKKVYTWDSGLWSLSSDTLYLWDGWNLAYELAEFADGFNAEKGYAWGSDLSGSFQGAGGVGGLLMVTLAQGSTFYPAYDGNGNVMGYYAADTGESVAEFGYGPFGEPLRATGGKAGEFDFRFSTKPIDPETGLVAYQLRYYNPETGRWLSRDLIGENWWTGELNLYAFVANVPVSFMDILGLAIYVESHHVLFGRNHSKVVIIPENQARWSNTQSFSNTTENGLHYMTLGAGTARGDDKDTYGAGKLVSNPNRPSDLNRDDNVCSIEVDLPEGLTEDEAIERLLQTDENYQDDLDYDTFPSPTREGQRWWLADDSYNSNSYVAGLLKAGGFSIPYSPPSSPGFNKPAPLTARKR